MTSISKQIIELANNFASHGGAVDERVGAVILRGPFATSEEQQQWLALRSSDLAPFQSLQIYDPALGGDLDSDESFAADRSVVLTIRKPNLEHVVVFIFSAGAQSYLRESMPVRKILSAAMDARAAFRALGLEVARWNPDQIVTPPDFPVPVRPRAFVRDYVPEREVPEDLSPWMLFNKPVIESIEFRTWGEVAARRLLAGLVSSAAREDDVTWLQVAGPPKAQFRADDPNLPGGYVQLNSCASWVFTSGQDIEARHLIFASELARAYRPNVPLPEVFANTLESAKATYEAHVQSSSRETLKTLSELRKSVIDEAQKITQRTQDLTSGLWRDVAVSAAPFVIKILGDATKAPNPRVTAGFYFASAIFIFISFTLQTQINKSYLDNQRAARTRWFETLYNYISSDERERIADGPIRSAEQSYETTKCRIALIYSVLTLILLGFGVYELTLLKQLDAIPAPPPAASNPPAVRDASSPASSIPSAPPAAGGDRRKDRP